jgi:hypothetical protein
LPIGWFVRIHAFCMLVSPRRRQASGGCGTGRRVIDNQGGIHHLPGI